jgi:hypothetical protein
MDKTYRQPNSENLKCLLSPSMSSAMSFMNTKNNRGPRTDPWGTPAFKSSNILTALDSKFFTSITFTDVK